MRQDEITNLLRPLVENMQLELWHVEVQGAANRPTLRIFIENAEKGISVEDCQRVSREVSALLDVEDPFAGAFMLEVSSPGLDRGLHALAHFQRFAGAQVKIKLRSSFEGRKNFNGLLIGVEEQEVILRQDDQEILFPFELIEKAQVVPVFETKGK